MKLTNNLLLAPLAKIEIEEITKIVKETIDVQQKPKAGITNAQMWQIHKQKRTFTRRSLQF